MLSSLTYTEVRPLLFLAQSVGSYVIVAAVIVKQSTQLCCATDMLHICAVRDLPYLDG